MPIPIPIHSPSPPSQAVVDIWIADHDALIGTQPLPILSDEEIARASRYYSDTARSAFIAGRVVARKALAHRCNHAPSAWVFKLGAHGQPMVDPSFGVYFSISHTRNMTLCVVARCPVGADVEFVDHGLNVGELSSIALSDVERRTLLEKHSQFRLRHLLQVWTLKEAYLKALGVGFSREPSSLEIDLASKPIRLVDLERREDRPWRLQTLNLGSDHIGALAVQSSADVDMRIYQIPQMLAD